MTCEEVDLQNAILNLALNARDAMPDGGVLSIVVAGVTRAHVAAELEVRVTDNGLGMSRETLARAFDPFFTTKTKGLGRLGLPIVRQLTRELGGSVEIASMPGFGTTVVLRLPSAPAAKRDQEAEKCALLRARPATRSRQPLLAGAR